MTLSDYRAAMLKDYWRGLLSRHQIAADMAKEAGVTVAYVYASLARHGLPTPIRGR